MPTGWVAGGGGLWACLRACVSVCVCVCVYVRARARMSESVTCARSDIHSSSAIPHRISQAHDVYIFTHSPSHTHTRARARTHARTHAQTHTRTHAHTHTHTRSAQHLTFLDIIRKHLQFVYLFFSPPPPPLEFRRVEKQNKNGEVYVCMYGGLCVCVCVGMCMDGGLCMHVCRPVYVGRPMYVCRPVYVCMYVCM